jgi:cob(I)alamin adenosyltransferase
MGKIYTKTGDCGMTGTVGGKRISKSDELARALGAMDELNSIIGICRYEIENSNNQITRNKQIPNYKLQITKELIRVQNNLMIITTSLAGSKSKIKPGEVKHLEKLIDKLTAELPSLNKFIYPVGYLQYARAVCRRAECEVVALLRTPSPVGVSPSLIKEGEKEEVLKYLNRLSDALFVMGRWVNFKTGIKEEKWEN